MFDLVYPPEPAPVLPVPTADNPSSAIVVKGEMFPIIRENGIVYAQATRSYCHGCSFLLHPVVHLHVFNSKGELYLQKRPEWKDVQPGKWDTATGGHVAYGESVSRALEREVEEEIGITGIKAEYLGRYVFESNIERELVYVFRTIYDGVINPSAEELDGGRFWSKEDIAACIGKGVFTPNFEGEYQRFFV